MPKIRQHTYRILLLGLLNLYFLQSWRFKDCHFQGSMTMTTDICVHNY